MEERWRGREAGNGRLLFLGWRGGGERSVSVSVLASALPTARRRLRRDGRGPWCGVLPAGTGSWGGRAQLCPTSGLVGVGGGSLRARLLSCAWGGFSPGAAGSACPALPPTPPPHPPSPVAHLDAGRGAEAAGNSGGPPQAQGSAATHGRCCRAGAVPHSAIPWLIIPSSPLQCISARGRVVQLLSTARSARTPASLQRPPVQVGRKPLPCPVGGAGSGALQHYRVLCSKGSPAAARQGPGTACLTSPPPPAGSDACRRDGLPGKLRERGRVLPFHPALLPVTYISCCQMEGGERSIASLPAPLLLGERFPGGAGRCCQVPALPSPPPTVLSLAVFPRSHPDPE